MRMGGSPTPPQPLLTSERDKDAKWMDVVCASEERTGELKPGGRSRRRKSRWVRIFAGSSAHHRTKVWPRRRLNETPVCYFGAHRGKERAR